MLHIVEIKQLLYCLEKIVFRSDIGQRTNSIKVEFLPKDKIRALDNFHKFRCHFRMTLPDLDKLLLDQVHILLDKLLVVLKAFGLVVSRCLDDILGMSFLLSFDEAERLTE